MEWTTAAKEELDGHMEIARSGLEESCRPTRSATHSADAGALFSRSKESRHCMCASSSQAPTAAPGAMFRHGTGRLSSVAPRDPGGFLLSPNSRILMP